MGFLIFFIYMVIAAAVAFGVVFLVGMVRRRDEDFMLGFVCDDWQYPVAVITAVSWPVSALIVFAIIAAVYVSVGGNNAH